MAVIGAAIVFSTLPAASAGRSRSLAPGERTNTMRIGETLALVGPIFARSTASRSKAAGTGRSCQPLWVRASRNSLSSAWARIASTGRARTEEWTVMAGLPCAGADVDLLPHHCNWPNYDHIYRLR